MNKNKLLILIGACVCSLIILGVLLFVFRCDVFGHQYDEVKTPPTCTEDGFTTYCCQICDHSEERNFVDKAGHTYIPHAVESSCTKEGYTNYNCLKCGDHYVGNYTPVREHRYKTTSTTATCSEAGINSRVCEDCGYSTTQEQAALGHNFVTKTNIAATCTGIGIKRSECMRCGEKKEETTPKLGHDWGGGLCNNCENIHSDYIDKKVVSADGKQIWKIFIHSMELKVNATYEGSGNFIIKLRDDNQDLTELICNEIGSYIVDKTVKVTSGWYYLEIYWTRGTWSMTWWGTYSPKRHAMDAAKDFRNANPDVILNATTDLYEHLQSLGFDEDTVNYVVEKAIEDKSPAGFYDGAAMSDEDRITYFHNHGYSREAIIKWYVNCGYSTKKATSLVDEYLNN